MKTQTTKSKTRHITNENNPEFVRHASGTVSADIGNQLKDVGKQTVNQLWDTLLLNKRALGGDLVEGEEKILFDAHKADEKPKAHAEAPINYFREIAQGETRVTHENEQQLISQITEIQMQIRALIGSTQGLKEQFTQVTVEQPMEKPGKYHKVFYEWFLSMLKNWRQNVEDAGAWMAALQSKKKSKGYWAMFKKHGTTFGLSSERYMVQQTG